MTYCQLLFAARYLRASLQRSACFPPKSRSLSNPMSTPVVTNKCKNKSQSPLSFLYFVNQKIPALSIDKTGIFTQAILLFPNRSLLKPPEGPNKRKQIFRSFGLLVTKVYIEIPFWQSFKISHIRFIVTLEFISEQKRVSFGVFTMQRNIQKSTVKPVFINCCIPFTHNG